MGNKYRGSAGRKGRESGDHGERDAETADDSRESAEETVRRATGRIDTLADDRAEAAVDVESPGDADALPRIGDDSPLDDVEIGDELDGFEVFVVGGAVRDGLRGGSRPPDDVDLMAVPRPEANIEDPVDELDSREELTTIDPESSFPVFLDSRDREVALPRTEESTGAGFKAFDVHLVPPDTPVEEAVAIDMERRDLRYNAIAYNPETGALHDPHGGREDLRDGRVRHVSDAFAEDPIRVLRMARFSARFDHEVDPETRELAREVAPDLEAVPGDRVRMEVEKAFKQADDPRRFFDEAREADALEVALPEIAALADDTGGEGAEDADGASAADADTDSRYERTMDLMTDVQGRRPNDGAALFASLGRYAGDTPESGIAAIRSAADRIGMDGDTEETMVAARRLGDEAADTLGGDDPDADDVVALVETLDGGRTASYTPEVALDIAAAERDDLDAERARSRVETAREVIDSVDGATVFDAEDLEPADLGPDGEVTGDEFGALLDDYRAERYRERRSGSG